MIDKLAPGFVADGSNKLGNAKAIQNLSPPFLNDK
jgi:hypothetical protein